MALTDRAPPRLWSLRTKPFVTQGQTNAHRTWVTPRHQIFTVSNEDVGFDRHETLAVVGDRSRIRRYGARQSALGRAPSLRTCRLSGTGLEEGLSGDASSGSRAR